MIAYSWAIDTINSARAKDHNQYGQCQAVDAGHERLSNPPYAARYMKKRE